MGYMEDRLTQAIEKVEEPEEKQILTAVNLQKWETVLNLVCALNRPVERSVASLCMEAALQCAPADVFLALLDKFPEGEWTGSVLMQTGFQDERTEVEGTLVTLAAALGRVEQLRGLLARGWDVNSASLDAAMALKERAKTMDPHYRIATQRFEPYSASSESRLRMVLNWEEGPQEYLFRDMVLGLTPLAAAILCGQTESARILMDHGAWKEKAPSVTRALLQLNKDGDQAYQSCRKAVLTYGNAPRPMALWAVIRSIREEQLEEELNRCPYDEEEIAKAVWELAVNYRMAPNRGPWAEERKRDLRRLQILERYYPQVLRRDDMVSVLLRQAFLQGCSEEWMNFLVVLCPKRVDLSLIREGLVRTPPRRVREILLRLCEGRTCVMDRDSVPPTTPVLVLQTLLQFVEFLPPASGQSVSGLTYAILYSGNLRLIRKALNCGAIPAEEPTPLLLCCLGEIPWAAMARSLLLTVPRPAGRGAWMEHRKRVTPGPMFRWLSPETQRLHYETLLEADCPEAVERELVLRGLYDPREAVRYETPEGKWSVESVLGLLCWTGRTAVVERWVRCGPGELLRIPHSIHPAGAPYTLKATPLCTAAFAGQAEVVRALLSLGASACEQEQGVPSVLLWGKEELPLTPLLAAVVRGHWETAALLAEHGAGFDMDQQVVKRLWNLFQTEDLHQAVQVHLNNTF